MPQKTTERQRHLGRGLESLLGPISSTNNSSEDRNTVEKDGLESFIDKTL